MVYNIAHRGAGSLAPENTLLAAETARRSGADLWETDVSVTRDGHLILFHDETLDRTTDVDSVFPDRPHHRVCTYDVSDLFRLSPGKRFVETDPFGSLKKNRVPSWVKSQLLSATIPTLEQALLFAMEHQWPVNLELKALPGEMADFPLPEKVLECMERLKISSHLVIISSFHHPWLSWIQERRPDIRIQALLNSCDAAHPDFTLCPFHTLNINHQNLSLNQLKALKHKNRKVNLYTVNDPEQMEQYLKAGVDGIITDYPQVLSTLIRRARNNPQT